MRICGAHIWCGDFLFSYLSLKVGFVNQCVLSHWCTKSYAKECSLDKFSGITPLGFVLFVSLLVLWCSWLEHSAHPWFMVGHQFLVAFPRHWA